MRLYAQHIDAIAREIQRDVLFIHFENYTDDQNEEESIRDHVIAWLEQHEIEFVPCLGLSGEDEIDSYLGDLYLDIPFDEQNNQYQLVKNYLEDEQGNMKIEHVLFFVLSLEVAEEIAKDQEEKQNLNDQKFS
ncbi:hypothetical protein [Acinetobacter sp. DSM 11652]|uniref:hypothetical protein n=1 Tax=Acinetobacter sp. DSM 11652 TaxID=346222 RepID=UPI0008C4B652|nr:hypothetical protein [Acinetobacter sp. DSM 11652]SEL21161.1 hypothetical protein SAMN05216500_10171 [Acinetobacter sp. DSM 11652]